MKTSLAIPLWLICLASLFAEAPPPDAETDANQRLYLQQVRPVLAARCYACHGSLKQEAGLRLDSVALIQIGGDSGSALDADQPAESLLWERISTQDPDHRMPPEGEPLSEPQLAAVRQWLTGGAIPPEDDQPEPAPSEHWSFRPIQSPTIPDPVKHHHTLPPYDANDRRPIDALIEHRADQHQLKLAPTASDTHWLRRAYLDLVGIPPTPEQLRRFLDDRSPDARQRVVDQLLAHPMHGERWGRHWMDIWRYSDWYGRRNVPDVLNSYAQIWRWRDWIVDSLNAGRPYDQMLQQMLAGDELDPTNPDALVATGLLVRNWYRWNYHTWMKDNVEHIGKGFLGLTFNCCECHDHKYDPISHTDYFALRAFFEPLELRHDPVPGEPDPGLFPKYDYGRAYPPITSGRVRVMDENTDAPTWWYAGGDERLTDPKRGPIAPSTPAFLPNLIREIRPIQLPPLAWYPGLHTWQQQQRLAQARQTELDASAKLPTLDAPDTSPARENEEETTRLDHLGTPTPATVQQRLDMQRAATATAHRHSLEARITADWVRYQSDSLAQPQIEAAITAACQAQWQADLADAQTALLQAQLELVSQLANESAARDALAGQPAPTDPATDASAADAPESDASESDAPESQALQAAIATAHAGVQAAEQNVTRLQDGGPPQQYTPLSHQYPTTSSGRRAALAQWLTTPEHPLPARVAANHLWGRHFNQYLCTTPDNLGRGGAPPTHPELIDWLARKLLDHQWDLKSVQRHILTSAAYGRSSIIGPELNTNLAADPDNRLLWRFPSRQLEGESLRDSLLAVAGELDHRFGGPEIEQSDADTSSRRSLYISSHGEAVLPWLATFDTPLPCDAYRRTTSIRPQQALALVNSPFAQQQADAVARRIAQQIDHGCESDFVAAAFWQILGRAPSDLEQQQCQQFLLAPDSRRQAPADDPLDARRSLCLVLLNHHEFLTVP
jgi:hypothetical protein